jgi:hypothetical protein
MNNLLEIFGFFATIYTAGHYQRRLLRKQVAQMSQSVGKVSASAIGAAIAQKPPGESAELCAGHTVLIRRLITIRNKIPVKTKSPAP